MMAAHRRGIHPVLAAELMRQVRLHGPERTVYLLQVALNDEIGSTMRWIAETGIAGAATIHFAKTLDPHSVAARIAMLIRKAAA